MPCSKTLSFTILCVHVIESTYGHGMHDRSVTLQDRNAHYHKIQTCRKENRITLTLPYMYISCCEPQVK